MALPAFNPLNYIKALTQGGVPREQAEVQAQALLNIVDEELASKRDLKEVENTLRIDIKASENALRAEIKEVENKLEGKIIRLEGRLTLLSWMLATALAGLGAIILKLFNV